MGAITLGEASVVALGRMTGGARRPGMAAPHRTGMPVRRDSIEAGSFEDMFFAAPAKGETDRQLRLARAALEAGRRLRRSERAGERTLSAAERAIAALTAGAVRVYEELLTLARLNRGRVYPSYDHLARATALGRATVARALAVLETAGFLVRQRRFVRVEGGAGGGERPRYAQTSNAYRPTLPARLTALLPRRFRPAPVPDDALQHRADAEAALAAMRATLSCRELATATTGGALGRMLARLGAAIDRAACESHDDPESFPGFIESGRYGVGLVDQHVRPDGPAARKRIE